MGRHAGFLTAASILAKQYPDDGPHLIYLPERPLTKDKFLADVQAQFDKYGRCIVAVSEGIVGPSGKAIAAEFTNEKDAHGNVQLSGSGALGDLLSEWVKSGTKIKRVRADTLGYLQRSFLGCVSEVDQREAREVGEKAAHYAIGHGKSGSVSIVRVGDYAVEYKLSELKDVARESVHMPDAFINADANGVTDAFVKYVRPLVGPLPAQARFSAPKVDKVLNK